MARRMYDLDNGTENIKVKSVKTKSISNADGILTIISPGGIQLVSQQYGNFYLDADGFVINSNNGIVTFAGAQIELGSFSTLARPTNGSQLEGAVIYDSTLKKCILWNGTAWVNLDGTALS